MTERSSNPVKNVRERGQLERRWEVLHKGERAAFYEAWLGSSDMMSTVVLNKPFSVVNVASSEITWLRVLTCLVA